ncbi:small, acid-soluble spore protein, H family [Brevibacillus sp. NPDC003359]
MILSRATRCYSQHVDEENDLARIYPLDTPERELSVPVASLREHGTY